MTVATRNLIVTSSPHAAGTESVPRIMHTVWLALLPACAAAVWMFGLDALWIIGLTTLACVVFEGLFLKMRGMAWGDVARNALDGSAIVTGVLLALNLPAGSPWWMVVVGALVAMALGKHVFGGLGNNPFNPALVARVFLLISFPVQMTTWSAPVTEAVSVESGAEATDAQTYATPLGEMKAAARSGDVDKAKEALARLEVDSPVIKTFLGNVGGSLGETSALALLLGAAILFWRRCISWHIPLTFIATTGIIAAIAWGVSPEIYPNPLYHLLSGGLLLGAFFMATDMVTSPVSKLGMVIFGLGCGAITAVIRLWGAYPEGVSFAILIMNGLVPLIDRYTKPRKFGQTKEAA